MFTLSELLLMRNRAWNEASRCWQEYRNAPMTTQTERDVAEILLQAAKGAEDYWAHLARLAKQMETA